MIARRIRAAALLIALAAAPAARAQTLPNDGPFVEHRLAIQLSDNSSEKQSLVLSVANNTLKVFGPDKVAIEVVAFGPGVELLREGGPNAERVASLVAQGVHFDACAITLATIARDTGKPFPLSHAARVVTAGVPQLMTLAEHGYVVVRP